jgi:hypothetical protein
MGQDGENKKKTSRWLRPLMFPFEEGEPKATFLALKHVGVSGKFADVRTMRITEPRDEAAFSSLMTDLEQAALDDCEGTGGVQKYVVQALDEGKHVISRLTLRYTAVRTEEEASGYDGESEPANALGITAQLMRHVEVRERIDKAGWGNIINTQRLTIEALTEQVTALQQKHLDMLEMVEEMTQAKHERELALLKETNAAEIKQRIGRTVTALLPAVAKKLTGADIGPVTDPETLSMRELLETLTEEQIERLMPILTPDQTMSLLSMMKGQAEKEKPDN